MFCCTAGRRSSTVAILVNPPHLLIFTPNVLLHRHHFPCVAQAVSLPPLLHEFHTTEWYTSSLYRLYSAYMLPRTLLPATIPNISACPQNLFAYNMSHHAYSPQAISSLEMSPVNHDQLSTSHATSQAGVTAFYVTLRRLFACVMWHTPVNRSATQLTPQHCFSESLLVTGWISFALENGNVGYNVAAERCFKYARPTCHFPATKIYSTPIFELFSR